MNSFIKYGLNTYYVPAFLGIHNAVVNKTCKAVMKDHLKVIRFLVENVRKIVVEILKVSRRKLF